MKKVHDVGSESDRPCGRPYGVGLCRIFNRATRYHTPPTYLSSDHEPLYRFHQWQPNLRILDVEAIKTVPNVPLSHPFVEGLIVTIRRECLDPHFLLDSR